MTTNLNLIMGIDEAGRGPVIGPMVVAGVIFPKHSNEFLREYGIKDSKQLSSEAREEMFNLIEEEATWYKIAVIWPDTIDAYVSMNGLNHLECDVMAELIDSFARKKTVYIDSPLDPVFFKEMLSKRLKTENEIKCSFKADTIYPVVSAASILAKVTRDRIIEELKQEYGDFGSGYPADEKTRIFLSSLVDTPYFIRKTWKLSRDDLQGSLF
ncbi:MAG: ribonuclease HII [Proteobacteria bacterium]|nr:ribonuclease HII [Pseudomonadota bacterium]